MWGDGMHPKVQKIPILHQKTKMVNYICKPFNELTLDQLYAIMVLRQEVFVVEQDCPYIDADNKDQDSYHLMGWNEENQLVAYTRLVPKGISYEDYISIGRVITSKLVRKQGVGIELMKKSIDKIRELFGTNEPIKISAQVYLLRFYNSLGFKEKGEEYLEDGIPHTAMLLNGERGTGRK